MQLLQPLLPGLTRMTIEASTLRVFQYYSQAEVAALEVTCPTRTCRAEPGDACHKPDALQPGLPVYPHSTRVRAAEKRSERYDWSK